MDPVQTLIYAAAVPAAVAAAVLLVLKWTRRGDGSVAGAGIALAAGFIAAYFGLGGRWRMPPVEASHALVPAAIAAAAALLIGVRNDARPALLRRALRFALVFAALWFSVLEKSPLWLGVGMGATLAFLWAMDVRAATAKPSMFLATLLIVSGATAIALGVSGTMTVAQFAGGLAAATGGCLAFALRRPVGVRGVAFVAGILLPMLWLNGWIFADLPLLSMLLLAVAPFAAWASGRLRFSRLRPGTAIALEIAVTALPCLAAIGVAVANSPPLAY